MLDMDELDRDPWPTYPVSKEELRKAHEVMTRLIRRVEELEAAMLQITETPPFGSPQDIARKALRGKS
jgi:hypothetical protein